MRTLHILFALLIPVCLNSADIELPQEVIKLQKERDDSLALINSRYIKQLKQQLNETDDPEMKKAIQRLIDDTQAGDASAASSVRDSIVSTLWELTKPNEETCDVRFKPNGLAIKADTKQWWWNWYIEGDSLYCNWFSHGTIIFEKDPESEVDRVFGEEVSLSKQNTPPNVTKNKTVKDSFTATFNRKFKTDEELKAYAESYRIEITFPDPEELRIPLFKIQYIADELDSNGDPIIIIDYLIEIKQSKNS